MAIKCFAMYSWDSEQHQLWVKKLVDNLIEYGIDATLDLYELGLGTKNLNRMMIDNIFNDGFLIVVMTDEYTKKANEETGGVGFETTSLMGIMKNKETRNRVILVKKENDIPNYLLDYEYIDFASGITEEKIKEVVRKITGNPLYKKPPLGSKKIEETTNFENQLFEGIKVPNLNPIQENDKEKFLKKSLGEIIKKIESGLKQIKNKNPNFSYSIEEKIWTNPCKQYIWTKEGVMEEIEEKKAYTEIKILLDNEVIKVSNFWLDISDRGYNSNSINYSHNNNYGFNQEFNPNGYNGSLSLEISNENTLSLKNTMGYSRDKFNIDNFVVDFINKEYIETLSSHWNRKYKY